MYGPEFVISAPKKSPSLRVIIHGFIQNQKRERERKQTRHRLKRKREGQRVLDAACVGRLFDGNAWITEEPDFEMKKPNRDRRESKQKHTRQSTSGSEMDVVV